MFACMGFFEVLVDIIVKCEPILMIFLFNWFNSGVTQLKEEYHLFNFHLLLF